MKTETYWTRALEQSERALKSGALVPLSTSLERISISPENNFELRTLESRLPKHLKREGPKPNPFQPWDAQLEIRFNDVLRGTSAPDFNALSLCSSARVQ